jgi:hypothetical protein
MENHPSGFTRLFGWNIATIASVCLRVLPPAQLAAKSCMVLLPPIAEDGARRFVARSIVRRI